MFRETEIQRVEVWRHEWSSSQRLRTMFPSVATYLVFKASECREFGKLRPRRKQEHRSKALTG
jgi:hypothetical protein